MEFIAKENSFAVRRMEENERDIGLMLRWMTDPETMRYWEGMTVHFDRERVLRDFYRHRDANVTPCILMKDGRDIGYLQFEKNRLCGGLRNAGSGLGAGGKAGGSGLRH